MNDFTVLTQQHTDRTTIAVSGEVDLQTCPQLAQAAFIAATENETLHLDLSGVSFMDSSGLNLLVLLRRRLQAKGGRLTVTGLQPQPAHLLQLTGTYEVFSGASASTPPPPHGQRP
ncbi:STAS domain-containing protein [Streptomyces sp. NPDC006743]|uniref:STAS domain-containing protein n=1 Tax=Streptomyces sp. NPDC006743 TaxID=3154480 RepID=UPI0034538204